MKAKMPQHVAIVMDGNGRWAEQRDLPRYEGHQAGAESVKKAIEFAVEHKIEVLSLFALSIENYAGRPPEEVEFLLSLLLESLRQNTSVLHSNKVRIRIIGNRSQLNDALVQQIETAEKVTQDNVGLTLVIAINYSGRWDILQATQRVARDVCQDKLNVDAIDDEYLSGYLSLSDLPEPDLLIRTSGELRISNFMLWQFAYTELFFADEYWPDFDAAVFQRAIDVYAQRSRRFGQTSEQLESTNA
jgi:undecaprenyl diphosphate synthase